MDGLTVSTASIVVMGFCALMGFVIPIGLLVWLKKRTGAPLSPAVAGALVFVVFALVLESIIHNLVLLTPVGQTIYTTPILYALYGGLAAGVFEETGRLVAMKKLKKKYTHPDTDLMYGAGHGGIEVVVILGVTMAQYMAFAVMMNAGTIDQVLAPLDDLNRGAAMAIFQSLATAAPANYLLSILERILAVVLHISLSVFVWQAANQKEKFYLFYAAIGLHALVDAVTALMSQYGVSVILIEVCLALMTVGVAYMAKRIRK